MNPELRAILDRLPPYSGNGAAVPMLPRQCYTSPAFFEFEREAVFARNWVCVGRIDQIAEPGDCFSTSIAGEPLIIARGETGEIRAMGAVCRHRGHVLSCDDASGPGLIRCPLHYWTYDLDGRLVGAPRMGDALDHLRETIRLPSVRTALWHGFIFVNLSGDAPPLVPSLAKVERCWEGYPEGEMVTVPPVTATTPLPWNWKIQLENFTDAYHPEFVHRGTHDFAPSTHPEGGVEFTPMADGDNAIVRSVPMLSPDGGMMRDGWGAEAMFPPIAGLSATQHRRLSFVMVPPNLQLMFAPGAVSYTLLGPAGAEATYASSDRGRLASAALDRDAFRFRRARRRGARRRRQDLGAGRAGQQRDAGRQALALYARRLLWPARNHARAVQCLAAARLPAGSGSRVNLAALADSAQSRHPPHKSGQKTTHLSPLGWRLAMAERGHDRKAATATTKGRSEWNSGPKRSRAPMARWRRKRPVARGPGRANPGISWLSKAG
jgi:phenylpropionate dioxygenase-like ring-hydroxylating dioxygenase large terminal subunit